MYGASRTVNRTRAKVCACSVMTCACVQALEDVMRLPIGSERVDYPPSVAAFALRKRGPSDTADPCDGAGYGRYSGKGIRSRMSTILWSL